MSELPSPAPVGSIAPRLTSLADGQVLLSWLEPHGETSDLRFALWRGGEWSPTTRIAANLPFATHPSEAPGIIALSRRNLIAYWTQHADNREKYPEETDVSFAVSSDGGLHWSAPTVASLPKTDAESSYASGAAIDGEHASLVWLDGREWKTKKRVTLRSGIVKSDGSLNDTTVLDEDTCTCCPTASVSSATGVISAYRDHTNANIRDIAILNYSYGLWAQPKTVHQDQWQIAGCPVNGPALDSDGKIVAIAWFTGAQDEPAVKLAFSNDGGANFSSPLRIDEGNAIGRVQVVLLPRRSAIAFWLERVSDTNRLLMRTVHENGLKDPPVEVTRGSDLGYPHVTRTTQGILMTWSEASPAQRVRVGLFPFTATRGKQ